MPITLNSLSLAGEFAVLSQLAVRGYNAALTLGHTKHVDILGTDPSSGQMWKIEVKTHARPVRLPNRPTITEHHGPILSTWVMQGKHETLTDRDLFYCFVSLATPTNGAEHSRFFIVPSKIVAAYVREQHQHWLSRLGRGGRSHRDSDRRHFRLGLPDGTYPVSTPPADDYEDHWKEFLGNP
jgi:hypothetical protein